MHTTEVVLVIVISCIIVGLVGGFSIHWCAKQSRFTDYNNKKNIEKAQRKLDKLTRKSKPDLPKIELAQKALDTEKLFSKCQRLSIADYNGGSGSVLFSDDNEVMMFIHDVIPYGEIESCSIVGNNITKSYTKTKSKGVIPRAIVGGAIAGGVGAVIGGMTAKSESNTTYYQTTEGFFFQLILKNKTYHSIHFRGDGLLSNKVPKNWMRLYEKIQTIIDNQED